MEREPCPAALLSARHESLGLCPFLWSEPVCSFVIDFLLVEGVSALACGAASSTRRRRRRSFSPRTRRRRTRRTRRRPAPCLRWGLRRAPLCSVPWPCCRRVYVRFPPPF